MRVPWLVIGVAVLAGCGGGDSESEMSPQSPEASSVPPTELAAAPETTEAVDDTTTTTVPPGPPRYEVWGMVTKHDERGTILCLGVQMGGVAVGSRVACGEPTYDVVGLDWDALSPPLPEGIANTHLLLTGTLDDGRITLTEQPDVGAPPPAPIINALDSTSACDPPPDGWAVRDPSTTSRDALEAAVAYAADQSEYGGWWIDRDSMGEPTPSHLPQTDDPAEMVLNVRFTDDLDRHEARIRDLWGGAMCVTDARYTRAEMQDIERQVVSELDELQFSTVHDAHGMVLIHMSVVPHGLQAEIDERFGEGVVLLTGSFRPVED